MAAARPRRRQAGFTLVELLLGIAIAMIFSAGLYAFFFAGTEAARSRESMGAAQSGLRTALERMSRDVRQGISPDDGLNGPIESLTSTSLVVHTDPNRSPTATDPRPQRVRYRLSGTDLVREAALPIGTAPPYAYSSYGPAEVLASGVANGATPIFTGFTQQGDQLGSPVAQPRDIAMVRIDVFVGQKVNNKATTVELSTDVTLRNSLRF